MKIQSFLVDAFTDQPFQGNPAGVCLLNNPIDQDKMQAIASEFNLSETAFLFKSNTSEGQYDIRYFTPTVEIDFCGHATLASSKVIIEKLAVDSVHFTTRTGLELGACKKGEQIEMKFPLFQTSEYAVDSALLSAFGIKSKNINQVRFSSDLDMLMIEVNDKETLEDIDPDYQKALDSTVDIKELVVTTRSTDKKYNFYSRCFCPWIGINEDPVTGASHSVLAKYWADQLNKKELSAYQLSKRGGYLNLRILSNTELEVISNAKIVFEGMLTL